MKLTSKRVYTVPALLPEDSPNVTAPAAADKFPLRHTLSTPSRTTKEGVISAKMPAGHLDKTIEIQMWLYDEENALWLEDVTGTIGHGGVLRTNLPPWGDWFPQVLASTAPAAQVIDILAAAL